jgi:tetratricopeptide (TPR) repeat protein
LAQEPSYWETRRLQKRRTALALGRSGDLKAAGDAYGRAEARGSPDAARQLGEMLRDSGNLQAAQVAFMRAEESGDVEWALRLGDLLRGRGDRIGAEHAYRRAEASGSCSAEIRLGALMEDDGDLGRAEAMYQRAYDQTPPGLRGVATIHLGRLMHLRGDTEGAEMAYNEAMRVAVLVGWSASTLREHMMPARRGWSGQKTLFSLRDPPSGSGTDPE